MNHWIFDTDSTFFLIIRILIAYVCVRFPLLVNFFDCTTFSRHIFFEDVFILQDKLIFFLKIPVTRSKSRLVSANQMSLRSRVVIQRNYDLDQQAFLADRPRLTRRASTGPRTPQSSSQSSSQSQPTTPKSAPNTPKSVKSILKGSKSKPFTLVGPKRPKMSKNSILNYLVPTPSSGTSPSTQQPGGSQDSEPSTSGHNTMTPITQPPAASTPRQNIVASISLPPTAAPESNEDRQLMDFNETTIPSDEFSYDILHLNEDDNLYVTDEEDI